jgi:hypothetical protein
MDAIQAMPSTAEDRDQTRVPDRSGPVNAFAFEVLPKVEDSRIAIGRWPPQRDNDFQLVAGPDIERIEKLKLIRVVEELRKTSSPSIRPSIDAKHLDVDVDAKSPPFGRTCDSSYKTDRVDSRVRWDSWDGRAQSRPKQKHRQQQERTSRDTEKNRQRKTHPHGVWTQVWTRENTGNQSDKREE